MLIINIRPNIFFYLFHLSAKRVWKTWSIPCQVASNLGEKPSPGEFCNAFNFEFSYNVRTVFCHFTLMRSCFS